MTTGRDRKRNHQRAYAPQNEPADLHPGSATGSGLESAPAEPARIFGFAPIIEALRAGTRAIEQIDVADGAQGHRLRELLDLAREKRVPVRRVPRLQVSLDAGRDATHQGVTAVIAAARYHDAAQLLDELHADIQQSKCPMVLVLDGVEDPRNLGAIIRTANCAGVHSIFIRERRAVGLTEIVAKASAGALDHTRVARVTNIANLIADLKALNVWTVGTSGAAPLSYAAWDWSRPCALVLGSEGKGVSRLVKERCDVLVRIPVLGAIDSLNVSVAAGIILYEALRSRGSSDTNLPTERLVSQPSAVNN